MLRRRGSISLMTFALSALVHHRLRWTSVTGARTAFGGDRASGPAGPRPETTTSEFRILVAVIALAAAALMRRFVNSPLVVLEAIRENETRATALGYDTQRYKLAAFVLSAGITALAGVLLLYKNRRPRPSRCPSSFGRIAGDDRHRRGTRGFGAGAGAVFYILFREYLSIYTENWLLWFGLVFMGFVLFARDGLVGMAARSRARLFGPDPPPPCPTARSRALPCRRCCAPGRCRGLGP